MKAEHEMELKRIEMVFRACEPSKQSLQKIIYGEPITEEEFKQNKNAALERKVKLAEIESYEKAILRPIRNSIVKALDDKNEEFLVRSPTLGQIWLACHRLNHIPCSRLQLSSFYASNHNSHLTAWNGASVLIPEYIAKKAIQSTRRKLNLPLNLPKARLKKEHEFFNAIYSEKLTYGDYQRLCASNNQNPVSSSTFDNWRKVLKAKQSAQKKAQK